MASHQNMRTAHSLQEKKRTTDVLSSENINVDFASLLLSEAVQKGLTAAGFEKPSPIQLKAIPLGRCGLDLIVQAKSGTGKTCVFSVIALESVITTSSSLQVLVLAPTREIAVQIQNVMQAIGVAMEGLKCHTFIGGTIFGQDRQHLKKCHIAVGTPGRIKQLIEYEVLKTDSVRMFVLDEADKLLDEKFQASVNWIYHQLPENKQMLALSATYPESLAQQLTNYMRDPTFVRLNPRDLTLQGIKQFYKIVPGHQLPHKSFQIKADHLVTLLSQVAFNQCLIFSNFQSRAHNLCELLLEKGWPATYISGNQEQADRMKAMAELKAYKCRILISTDLTSRGIDAENVNLIINLDVPMDFKTYLHRIGRAGRFGTHGAAVTLASEGQEVSLLQTVKKRSGSDIRLLPDPVPSNLLDMSVTQTQMQREVLEPTDIIGSAENDLSVGSDTSQPQGDEPREQSFALREGTKQSNYPQSLKDGAVDGEVGGAIGTNGYSPAEDRYQMSSKKQSLVSLEDKDTSTNNEIKHHESKKDMFERPDRITQRNGTGAWPEGGGNQFQGRNRASHRWMVDLEEWMLPITVMEEVRKTSRKKCTWEEAVKKFENGRKFYKSGKVSLEAGGREPYPTLVDGSSRDESEGEKLKEDGGEERLGQMTESGKELNIDTSGKVDALYKVAKTEDDINVKETEEKLKNSDVFLEFQAMKALLEQCKAENAFPGDVDGITTSAKEALLRKEEMRSEQETVSESFKEEEDNLHKHLLSKDESKKEESVEEILKHFRLDEEELQNEILRAGGDGEHIGKYHERNCGKDLNPVVTSPDGVCYVETCDVGEVQSVERTYGFENEEKLIKTTSSLEENKLYNQPSGDMKSNHNERKLKDSSKEGQEPKTSEISCDGHFEEQNLSCNFGYSNDGETKGVAQDSDWKNVTACDANISKENWTTSDKIWEYFKQYVNEDSLKQRLSLRKFGESDNRIANTAFAESLGSDSESSSFSSTPDKTSKSEKNLLDPKMSDTSTGSVKLNGYDSSLRSNGEGELHKNGKARNMSKGQNYDTDEWYSHYPCYNGRQWNEAASWYRERSYSEGWDHYLHPSSYTEWGQGYGEWVQPHSYWDEYFKHY